MTLAAWCHRAPPHCGERPSGYDNAVSQGQVSDLPSKATNTKRVSQGGHEYCATSKGETSQAQSSMVSTTSSDDMLAIAVNSSPKHAMSRAQKLYSSCRTVQVLPECLRLSKVPAMHCSIAIPLGQPGNPEITPLSRRVSQPDSL